MEFYIVLLVLIVLIVLLVLIALVVAAVRGSHASKKKADQEKKTQTESQEKQQSFDEKSTSACTIRAAIDLLHDKFGVPYPYLHLLSQNDDCLYFEITDSLVTARKKESKEISKSAMKLMNTIFEHVGIPKDRVTFDIEFLDGPFIESTEMGTYQQKTHYTGHVHMKYHPRMGTDQVISLISHECMHHLLRQKGVGYEDTKQNEILTDVAVVFFGMGGTMSIGYQNYKNGVFVEETETQRKITYHTYKLGYLEAEEVEYARKCCDKLRNKWIEQRKKALDERKMALTRCFVLNRALFRNSLDVESKTMMTKSEYLLLSQNAVDVQDNPENVETIMPKPLQLELMEDYRRQYREIMSALDACIKKYEEYNAVLNKYLGYI